MTIKRVYLMRRSRTSSLFAPRSHVRFRRINKEVEGMEDYVTSDERPLDKCRNGVAAADIYVGLFAHRYGLHSRKKRTPPVSRSPNSNTGMHCLLGKKCLLFLLDRKATVAHLKTWITSPARATRGKRVEALRLGTRKEKTATISGNEEELAALVTAAITNLEAQPANPPPPPLLPSRSQGGARSRETCSSPARALDDSTCPRAPG